MLRSGGYGGLDEEKQASMEALSCCGCGTLFYVGL